MCVSQSEFAYVSFNRTQKGLFSKSYDIISLHFFEVIFALKVLDCIFWGFLNLIFKSLHQEGWIKNLGFKCVCKSLSLSLQDQIIHI